MRRTWAWVNSYYNTFVRHQEKLTDYQSNPNIAVVSGFMCCETDEEANTRRAAQVRQ